MNKKNIFIILLALCVFYDIFYFFIDEKKGVFSLNKKNKSEIINQIGPLLKTPTLENREKIYDALELFRKRWDDNNDGFTIKVSIRHELTNKPICWTGAGPIDSTAFSENLMVNERERMDNVIVSFMVFKLDDSQSDVFYRLFPVMNMALLLSLMIIFDFHGILIYIYLSLWGAIWFLPVFNWAMNISNTPYPRNFYIFWNHQPYHYFTVLMGGALSWAIYYLMENNKKTIWLKIIQTMLNVVNFVIIYWIVDTVTVFPGRLIWGRDGFLPDIYHLYQYMLIMIYSGILFKSFKSCFSNMSRKIVLSGMALVSLILLMLNLNCFFYFCCVGGGFIICHFLNGKTTFLWVALMGFICLSFHLYSLWEYQKRILHRHEPFIFNFDKMKYNDLVSNLLSNEITYLDWEKNTPYIIWNTSNDDEVVNRIPYPLYLFWKQRKHDLVYENSINLGSYFYGRDRIYFYTIEYKEKRVFIPYVEKNVYFWENVFPEDPIYSEDLLSLKNTVHEIFNLDFVEYRNQWLNDSKLNTFPYSKKHEKSNDSFGEYIIEINDPEEEDHLLLLRLTFPSFEEVYIRFITLFCVFLVFYLSYKFIILMVNKRFDILTPIIYSIFWKNLIVNFIALLILFGISYWLIFWAFNQNRHDENKKYVKEKVSEVESFFREKMEIKSFEMFAEYSERDEIIRYIPEDIIFYFFDIYGKLRLSNSDELLLNERMINIVERVETPLSFWEMIGSDLFFVHVFPVLKGNEFQGMAVLLYQLKLYDLLAILDKIGIQLIPYWQELKYQAPEDKSLNSYRMSLLPFPDYRGFKNDERYETVFAKGDERIFLISSKYCLEKGDMVYGLLFKNNHSSFNRLMTHYITIFSIIIPLWFLLLYYLNRKLSANIGAIVRAIPLIMKGKYDKPLPDRGKDEVSRLSRAVNFLMKNLRKERELSIELEKERLITQLAREIAHEIKNPLTPMVLSIQHLDELKENDPDEMFRIFPKISQRLKNNIETLKTLSNRFSTLAKMEVESLDMISPLPIIRDVVEMFMANSDIKYSIVEQVDSALKIYSSEEALRRIMINLIKNASEAVEGSKGEILITIYENDEDVIVVVEDNGPGFRSALDDYFLPYYTTKKNGSGLGLTISKKLVEMTRGDLRIENRKIGGAKVISRFNKVRKGV